METMPEPRERDSQVACGSAKEVRAGLQLAVAYGYVPTTKIKAVDIALDEVCAMSWRLSGR